MSYTLTLQCGCTVYVATHPTTGVPHSRILEQRAPGCTVRKHEVGLHLALWELLPKSEESQMKLRIADCGLKNRGTEKKLRIEN